MDSQGGARKTKSGGPIVRECLPIPFLPPLPLSYTRMIILPFFFFLPFCMTFEDRKATRYQFVIIKHRRAR